MTQIEIINDKTTFKTLDFFAKERRNDVVGVVRCNEAFGNYRSGERIFYLHEKMLDKEIRDRF